MTEQDFKEEVFDIGKSIITLQILGVALREVTFRLPSSRAKEYLLAEMSRVIKFKTAHDFYYLQNKIAWMINMVERYGIDGKVPELLEEIKIETKKVVDYIEKEDSSEGSW